MKITADGFEFDFTDASDVFIFDEKDKAKPTYHGVPMKAVDIIAEFSDAFLFVEVKDFHDPTIYDIESFATEAELEKKKDSFRCLKNSLKYKYRDTYLFRHSERKIDKPIHFICLLTFESALNTVINKALRQELPVGLASKRWKQEIAASCHVVNVTRWNENFPKWPVCQASA